MHPIVTQELIKEIQRGLQERVSAPRTGRPASRKRWWRTR